MRLRLWFLMTFGFMLVIALGAVEKPVQATAAIRLWGWEENASYHSGGGPGRDSFELSARVEWPAGLAGRYELRITLPDGRVEAQPLVVAPGQTPRRIAVFVPAGPLRNLRPAAVLVRVQVVEPAANVVVSNSLEARITDFPRPRPRPRPDEVEEQVVGPFGWGTPLKGQPGEARVLPRPGPLDFRFAWIPGEGANLAFFIATTELSNSQLSRLLADYDPRAGRSDEFLLEAPTQPAIGLTAARAQAALARLSQLDPAAVAYRLPTVSEWRRAALGGRTTAYWWGDEVGHEAGANLLGPEAVLTTDTTAPAQPGTTNSSFTANPWGLFHTFGNVAEWATDTSGRFVRLGGHFRTEPGEARLGVAVPETDSTGPDPYVGLRPAFNLDAKAGAALILKALARDSRLSRLQVAFDPARATATLTGTLPEPRLRQLADRALAPLWFVAAVENRVETPKSAAGLLARLGGVAGPVRRVTPLGRRHYEVPVQVRWSDPLPVTGSEWWVNIYLPGGGRMSHRLMTSEPDQSRSVTVSLDRARMAAAGLAPDAPVSVALSLGGEAVNPADPRIVSNVVPLRWKLQ